MLTQALLNEVERQVVARNDEVVLFLVKRLCNHQKIKLRLHQFCQNHPSIDWFDDEFLWRHRRRLQKKISFSDPCYRCPACRKDPIVLARLKRPKEVVGASPFTLDSF